MTETGGETPEGETRRAREEDLERELLVRMRGPYLESAGQKIQEAAVLLCRAIADGDPGQPEVSDRGENPLARAMRLAHSLVGSGASYGLPGVTTRARVIESQLKAVLEGEGSGDASTLFEPLCNALELRRLILLMHEGGADLL